MPLPVRVPIVMRLGTAHAPDGLTNPSVHILARGSRHRVGRADGCRKRVTVNDGA